MAVLRSSSKGLCGSSSSNSRNLRPRNVSDPSLDGSKRLCLRVARAGPKAKPRKERKYTSKDSDDDHEERKYATDAMSFYNKEKGTKYELVKPGCITSAFLESCFLHHINFTAKKAGVADAPEEMFFAELKTTYKVCVVELCKSMGPESLIKGDKTNGCSYCNKYDYVQQPRDGGFTAGEFLNYSEWKKNHGSLAC
ncbi:hypothetical protein MKW98_012315 [Papaver atlanticum]|uniref:DUF3615 domain-containing protein n=1 Tax=Papaver atlanticum TaxID=357466 RepID=A0AAD4XPP0_9MAGN|nr:hypothetical protein MKW98_012315 [Papaver atlanticum]